MTLNCQLGFPLQVLQMTSTLLNYHPESRDMPSGHVHSTLGTCDMPSGHMLPTIHETYNMPIGCMVSPRMSGCTTLTYTIPLTLTFPGCFLMEGRHTQDTHSPLKRRNIHKTVTLASWIFRIHMTIHSLLCMTYMKQPQRTTPAASLTKGRHTQDRYPNRSDLPERPYTQTDLNPYDSFLDDSSPDSYLLLDDSFT